MVFIHLRPFAPKKILVCFATLFCVFAGSCLAGSMFLSVESTPYDRQMSRIQPILAASKNGSARRDVPLSLVNHWMENLRSIPYAYQAVWKTPAEVGSGQPSDCKGKAVALYQRMLESGAKDIHLVIGRRTRTSRMTHTWIVWNTERGDYLLDPTFNWMACRADKIGDRSYLPMYAYAGDKKFRANSTTLLASN